MFLLSKDKVKEQRLRWFRHVQRRQKRSLSVPIKKSDRIIVNRATRTKVSK